MKEFSTVLVYCNAPSTTDARMIRVDVKVLGAC